MNALAILALALVARALFPATAQADIDPGGAWAQVCCGIGCGGYPYCAGTGPYTCCN
jgi:hypothetical protein